MARPKWKSLFICQKLQRYFFLKKSLFRARLFKLKMYNRSSTITKSLFKKSVFIYKGNEYKHLYINPKHFTYKLGEFSFTRKPFYFPIKEKKKKKR